MDKKIKKIDDTEVEKYELYQYKIPILIDDIDLNKILVSNRISFIKIDFKYLICNKEAKKLDLDAYSFQK